MKLTNQPLSAQQKITKKLKRQNPKAYRTMETRAKLNNDIEQVKVSMFNLNKQFGFTFLPLLVVCSESKADILRMNVIPEDEKIRTEMLFDMGKFIAESINDAIGFVLVYQTTLKRIKMVAKSFDGLSRLLLINTEGGGQDVDTGWNDREINRKFFLKPNLDNLEELWRSYKFHSIINIKK